jgi:hypothetical protein
MPSGLTAKQSANDLFAVTEYRRLAAAARRVSEAKKRARPGVFA